MMKRALMMWLFWLATAPLWSQCFGDLDQNGQIEQSDLQVALPTWHLSSDQAGFVALADYNHNDLIEIQDLVALLNGLGGLCGPAIESCPVFPANNIWNTAIDTLPVHPLSSNYIQTIGANTGFHMDFGSGTWEGAPIGIPFDLVDGSQTQVPISFLYEDESDPGPYPIPATAQIEGGPNGTGDRHVLVIDRDNCVLYELYRAFPNLGGATWDADSGAVYDLNSNALRPDTWTSADAAGLPIFPGLVRFEEVEAGLIAHAIRFTAPQTQRAYVWPARHYASSSTDPNRPPMGIRVRLKASYTISGFSARMQVILQALKHYGMILADNGSPWYLSGIPNEGWDNDELHTLDVLRGSDFEVVDVSSLMIDPDSGEAIQPP